MTAFGMIAQEMDGEGLALPKILQKVAARAITDVRARAFEARQAPNVTDFIPAPSQSTETAAPIVKIQMAPSMDTTSPAKVPAVAQVNESGFPIATATSSQQTAPATPSASAPGTAPGFLDQELIPGIRNLWLIAGAGGLLLLIVLLRGRK